MAAEDMLAGLNCSHPNMVKEWVQSINDNAFTDSVLCVGPSLLRVRPATARICGSKASLDGTNLRRSLHPAQCQKARTDLRYTQALYCLETAEQQPRQDRDAGLPDLASASRKLPPFPGISHALGRASQQQRRPSCCRRRHAAQHAGHAPAGQCMCRPGLGS